MVLLAVMKKMGEFLADYIFLAFFRTQKHLHHDHFEVFQKVVFQNLIILNGNSKAYSQIKLSFFCIYIKIKILLIQFGQLFLH